MRTPLYILMLYLFTVSCDHPGTPEMWEEIQNPLDTCETPILITQPEFVNGYLDITDPIFTDRIIMVGPYADTIYADISDELPMRLDSMLELWRPQYNYTSYAIDNSSVTTIVDGTNDRHQFIWNVRMRYNNLTHYTGWGTQTFYFAGAMTYGEHKQAAEDYPSVKRFNFRLSAFDSLQFDTIARIILGDCKEGRDWADFRWGTFDPDLVQDFEDAGWNQVWPVAPGTIRPGDNKIDGTYLSQEQLLKYADAGRQIIIRPRS